MWIDAVGWSVCRPIRCYLCLFHTSYMGNCTHTHTYLNTAHIRRHERHLPNSFFTFVCRPHTRVSVCTCMRARVSVCIHIWIASFLIRGCVRAPVRLRQHFTTFCEISFNTQYIEMESNVRKTKTYLSHSCVCVCVCILALSLALLLSRVCGGYIESILILCKAQSHRNISAILSFYHTL